MREDPFLIQHFKLFLSFNYNLLRLHDKILSTNFQYILALFFKKKTIVFVCSIVYIKVMPLDQLIPKK